MNQNFMNQNFMNQNPMNQNFVNQAYANTTVTNLPPIVTRQVNVVHRYQIINQPHIMENVTQVCNHCIKRHQCIQKPICCEHTDYKEEQCPGMVQTQQVEEFENGQPYFNF